MFQKGKPRPANAGRKKGSKNKVTKRLETLIHELGCDPLEGMARIAADESTTPELRFRCYAELAQYRYPKRRAVEISGPGGSPIDVNVSGLDLLKSRIDSLAQRRGA